VTKGRVSTGVTLTIVSAMFVLAPLAGVAAAGGSGGGSGGTEVLATLKVENPNVEVKKAGANAFKEAKDDQKLREGDTVRTDATGRAEVDYSDDAYTRLDVNTTFTIVKLTEEQGERQIEGGLESGRTWNRTEAVTQSGSFEQGGGGAVAAVTGTAFPVECISTEECIYTGVDGTFILTGKDGEARVVEPLQECGSDDGDLCDEVRQLTSDELAANQWIQENLLRDLLERGYGPGPFTFGGTLVIENGQFVSFTESPDNPPPPSTTTLPTKPALKDPPLDCEVQGSGDSCTHAALGDLAFQPTTEIIVYEEDVVLFKARVESNGATGVSIIFDEIPTNTGEYCREQDFTEGCEVALQTGVAYNASQVFVFHAAYCPENCPSGTLIFHLKNAAGSSAKEHVQVSVELLGCEAVTLCGQSQASTSAGGSPPSSTTTAPPSSTTTTTLESDPSTTTTTIGQPSE